MSDTKFHWATDLPILVFGRRAKPQAIVALLGLFGVTIGPWYEGGASAAFDFTSIEGVMMSVFAAVTIAVLVVGWWLRSSRLLRTGLFGAVIVFSARAFLAGMISGLGHPAMWISAGLAVGMAWAWLIERAAAQK